MSLVLLRTAHPDHVDNGWIYLSFGDRCTDCGARPKSMIKLVRGRLKDDAWVDEETVYQAAPEHYNAASDMAAGGRIAFDHAGHVFPSLGMKADTRGSRISGYPTARCTACTTTAASPKTTHSVAVSSFVFYEGEAFPGWRGHMLVGASRAATSTA